MPRQTTVLDIINAFQSTTRWNRGLSDNSQRAYQNAYDVITPMVIVGKKDVGHTSVTDIRPQHVELLYNKLCDQYSIASASLYMRVMRTTFESAQRLDIINSNPFMRVTLITPDPRSTTWSPTQLNTFIMIADELGLSSIGTLALMAYDLCQRPIDCRLMTWSNYLDGEFCFHQQKTGTLIETTASDALINRLDALTSNHAPDAFIINYEGTGEPYSERLYRKKAQLVRKAAGLPDDLKIADLRRTGASELGEADCTEDQIRSVTGHKSRQVVSTYVKTSRRMANLAQTKRRNNNEVLHG